MASEKVQYYMERAIPELKELEQKGVLSKVSNPPNSLQNSHVN
jgi:hypothetical protein